MKVSINRLSERREIVFRKKINMQEDRYNLAREQADKR